MSSDNNSRNREAWLTDLAALMLPLIRQRTGLSLIERTYKLSCGFPSTGGTRKKNRTIGECHHAAMGEGNRKFHQIFVHPQLTDPVEIGGVVVHELLHAMLDKGVGHRKPFSQAAKKVGLEGKPTATTVGEELAKQIKEAVQGLGDYPHEALDAGRYGPARKALYKTMCPLCGFFAMVTRKWLEEVGPPICPQCNVDMQEAGAGEEASDPLTATDQTVEYAIKSTAEARRKATAVGLVPDKYETRWMVRMNRKGNRIQWWVMDYGAPYTIETDGQQKAVLGPVTPRLTPAESRQDAVALLEALRDGTLTYEEIEVNDDDPDWDDPNLDENDPDPYFADEGEEETADFEDTILNEEELAEYEAEERQREGGG